MTENGLLIATKNMHKVEEIGKILADRSIILKTLDHFPEMEDAVEDGGSYEENACKKAVYYASRTGCIALADDSGLEIDALGGIPGIHSARFIGPHVSFRERNEHILERMKHIDDSCRNAHFTCVVAVSWPDGKTRMFRGELHGFIAREMKGEHGFGYDPVFYVPEYDKNLAELESAEKNRISHRSRALAAAREALRDMFPSIASA
jgi:XTP/dITP diphosphohydrolase